MHDADALLCENCGYGLSGLDSSGVCPECAAPIARSLPARRTGTPWQRKKSVGALVRTMWLAARHPVKVWDEVRVAPVSASIGLAAAALGVVALAWGGTLGVFAFIVLASIYDFQDGAVFGALVFFVAALGSWIVLAALVLIEMVGIRLFGRRRGWRTTREVAWAVIAHACAGWMAGNAVLAAGVLFVFGLGAAFDEIAVITIFGHLFIGLLAFETLVYIGWRRMRFANRPGAR